MMKFQDLELSIISSFYFDQKAADALYKMLDYYSAFSPDLLKKVQFILIDDCSKIEVPIPDDLPLNFQLLKVKDDIFWNNGGARNLGVMHARTTKILLTDIDHFFSEKLLQKIIAHTPGRRTIYKFKRTDIQGNKMRSQPNILYMRKGLYFDGFGYDEEFSGNYGSEDSFFLDLMKFTGIKLRYFTRWIRIAEQKVDRQNAYHSFSRDITVNHELRMKKLKIMNEHGAGAAHSRLFLNFRWEKVKERLNAPGA